MDTPIVVGKLLHKHRATKTNDYCYFAKNAVSSTFYTFFAN